MWLEIVTDDVEAGARTLSGAGGRVADELEPLDGVDGHWIVDPAGMVLLLTRHEEEE